MGSRSQTCAQVHGLMARSIGAEIRRQRALAAHILTISGMNFTENAAKHFCPPVQLEAFRRHKHTYTIQTHTKFVVIFRIFLSKHNWTTTRQDYRDAGWVGFSCPNHYGSMARRLTERI